MGHLIETLRYLVLGHTDSQFYGLLMIFSMIMFDYPRMIDQKYFLTVTPFWAQTIFFACFGDSQEALEKLESVFGSFFKAVLHIVN